MKAAVIGASIESIHAIEKAKEQGITVVALDGNPKAEGLLIADIAMTIDIREEEQVISALKQEKIDFILPVPIGRYLTTAGAVNDALHLKGISKEAAAKCTDKFLFHECLAKEKLRNCRCYLIPGGKSQKQEIDKLEASYPLILKPRYGSGSRGIFFICDKEELSACLKTISDEQEDYILEEIVEGTEYGVDGAVIEGEFQMILLRKKKNTPPPACQAVGYISEEIDKRVADYLSKVCNCLGLTDTLFHADLMIQGNKLFVIELSARPSGHNLHNLFTPLCTNVDIIGEYIRFCMGNPFSFEPLKIKKMMIHYFDLPVGAIGKVPTEKEAARQVEEKTNGLCKLEKWECTLQDGDNMQPVTDGHSIMGRGYFILEAKREQDLIHGADVVLSSFTKKIIE